ncbi:YraN family protein [Pseudomonadota bacterium]
MKKNLLGQQGENQAKKYLKNKGYSFLSQNFQTKLGEIDLIFQHNNTVVFVEVKTRKNTTQGLPQEAVTPHKLKKITKVAQQYINLESLNHLPARIDVVAIDHSSTPSKITHLENVSI